MLCLCHSQTSTLHFSVLFSEFIDFPAWLAGAWRRKWAFLLGISFLIIDNACLRLPAIIENAFICPLQITGRTQSGEVPVRRQYVFITIPTIYRLWLVCMHVIAANCRSSIWVSEIKRMLETQSIVNTQNRIMSKYNFLVELLDYFQTSTRGLIPQFKPLYSRQNEKLKGSILFISCFIPQVSHKVSWKKFLSFCLFRLQFLYQWSQPSFLRVP